MTRSRNDWENLFREFSVDIVKRSDSMRQRKSDSRHVNLEWRLGRFGVFLFLFFFGIAWISSAAPLQLLPMCSLLEHDDMARECKSA